MAVQLPHSVFFHIPKTGGTWVRSALARAGIPLNEVYGELKEDMIAGNQIFHARPDELRRQGFFSFAFVRHPLGVYQSYWCYKMLKGPQDFNAFDREHFRENFSEFVEGIVKRVSWVSNGFRWYVGGTADKVDFIGKQECLADDLVRALHEAGEQFDEKRLRATPRVNQTLSLTQLREQCQYTPALRRAVCEREWWTLKTFGYGDEQPQSLTAAASAHPQAAPVAF
jgi:hypothetical protein